MPAFSKHIKEKAAPATPTRENSASNEQAYIPPAYGLNVVDIQVVQMKKNEDEFQDKWLIHKNSPILQEQDSDSQSKPLSQYPAGPVTKLSPEVNEKMKKLFKEDFSEVKIFPESRQASSLGALAFTRGQEVHFAPNQYAPHSQKGEKLLKHEFAHIIQQKKGKVKLSSTYLGANVNNQPNLEREADDFAQGRKNLAGENKAGTNERSVIQAQFPPIRKRKKRSKAEQLKEVNDILRKHRERILAPSSEDFLNIKIIKTEKINLYSKKGKINFLYLIIRRLIGSIPLTKDQINELQVIFEQERGEWPNMNSLIEAGEIWKRNYFAGLAANQLAPQIEKKAFFKDRSALQYLMENTLTGEEFPVSIHQSLIRSLEEMSLQVNPKIYDQFGKSEMDEETIKRISAYSPSTSILKLYPERTPEERIAWAKRSIKGARKLYSPTIGKLKPGESAVLGKFIKDTGQEQYFLTPENDILILNKYEYTFEKVAEEVIKVAPMAYAGLLISMAGALVIVGFAASGSVPWLINWARTQIPKAIVALPALARGLPRLAIQMPGKIRTWILLNPIKATETGFNITEFTFEIVSGVDSPYLLDPTDLANIAKRRAKVIGGAAEELGELVSERKGLSNIISFPAEKTGRSRLKRRSTKPVESLEEIMKRKQTEPPLGAADQVEISLERELAATGTGDVSPIQLDPNQPVAMAGRRRRVGTSNQRSSSTSQPKRLPSKSSGSTTSSMRPESPSELEKNLLDEHILKSIEAKASQIIFRGGGKRDFETLINELEKLQRSGAKLPHLNREILEETTEQFIERHPELLQLWNQIGRGRVAQEMLGQEIHKLRVLQRELPFGSNEFRNLERKISAIDRELRKLYDWGSGLVGKKRPDLVEIFPELTRVEVTDITYMAFDEWHNFKTLFYSEVVSEILGGWITISVDANRRVVRVLTP